MDVKGKSSRESGLRAYPVSFGTKDTLPQRITFFVTLEMTPTSIVPDHSIHLRIVTDIHDRSRNLIR